MESKTPIQSTDLIEIAANFVNSTSRHIFLTGKAGTGKTTFLHNLAVATHKKHLIVAPTGIAALNAGGVTIHSQFLLPFGSFNPDEHAPYEPNSNARFYNAKELVRRHPLNSVRKQVLRDIDLLIIDEVSMLRADLLDAIDHRMRTARRNHRQAFGGVQLLLIGDLFQLPPIVKDHEWNVLRHHYPTPHFFSSQALRKEGYVFVELDKVFRQTDNSFIDILNNLRNNECTAQDIATLNSHYKPTIDKLEGVVTLTTHNYQANSINQKALEELPEKEFKFKAEVKSDFPEQLFPLPETLVLKKGAQIMFIKNDPEGRFFNGKLAKVIDISSDHIEVAMSGEDRELSVDKMQWDNVKYGVDDNKEITEEVAGTFSHYPIKLAWAITVHKSQGLTFDKAVIDVGQAFAPGQVYVALSRLRSLDGLILRTKINTSAISSDEKVIEFQKSRQEQGDLKQLLRTGQAVYLHDALHSTFNFEPIADQIDYVQRKVAGKMEFEDADLQNALPNVRQNVNSEFDNARKFRNQITNLLHSEGYEDLKVRVEKGSAYYLNFLYDMLYQILLHKEEAASFARSKTYVNAVAEVDQLIMRKISDLQKAQRLTKSVLSGKEIENGDEERRTRHAKRESFLSKIENHIRQNPRKGTTKTGKKRKTGTTKGKAQVGATYEETYQLIKDGLSVEQIAAKRSMAESTIEGHVAKGIAAGKVDVLKFLKPDEIDEITKAYQSTEEKSMSDVFASFKGKYSYGKLRMVQVLLQANE
ncbi:AAA family ATPase [Cryomorpha ignava]|uniref:AAA family ATPase n=1 Tax=Cryomorpha ignava TaxID=101383 RepID=A0A7K3WQF2_9FLAO|nr:helix-turn-helix domain-containing protein [Cryomorpha ignava]NEN23724.1 AAA family ATPase [Cryomorpha ignava]